MVKKILVADDDPTLTRLLESYLMDHGYQVITAADGDEALEKLEQERPDLVVLDVVMPKTNGYAFLFAMRRIDGAGKTPVIVLTCKPELAGIFKAEGVQEYLIKPFPQKELLEKIRKYI
ncbi:MAG: response regulator [Candidatus Omnitrophica bacterium]|nr:response regulator [Candidatus Omnitrophota bacterium]